MDINNLIPVTGSIPIPAIWFEILSVLTFVLHIVMMNALVGGGFIALLNHWSKGSSSALLARNVKSKLPTLLAFTVNFGIAPLLFLQVIYGSFIYSSAVLMSVYLLSIILLVILAYYALYIYDATFEKPSATLILTISLIMLLVVGFFITNLITMANQPEKWLAYFDNSSGTLLALEDLTMYTKFLHMLTGIIAVGGLAHVVLWKFKKGAEESARKEGIATGMKWFKHATLANIVFGTLYLLTLPGEVMKIFMGRNIIATASFAVAILLLILVLVAAYKKMENLVIYSTVVLLIVMATMRSLMRMAYLQPYFSSDSLEVTWKLDSFYLFAATLVVGLVIVAYMLKLYLNTVKEG